MTDKHKPTVVVKKKRLLTDKRCDHCGHVTRWPCKSSDAKAVCHRMADSKRG